MSSLNKFFITGLPRSRTAWMSVFLSGGNTICYHDACENLSDIKHIDDMYRSDFYKHVGISDSGLGFFLPYILEHVKPRTLIIERDPADVIESLKKISMLDTNFIELLHQELLKAKGHPLVMWVPFESLDSKRVMQKIFWHLMPGEPFDEVHYDLMSKMNIQCDIEKVMKRAHNKQDSMANLLRHIIPQLKVST